MLPKPPTSEDASSTSGLADKGEGDKPYKCIFCPYTAKQKGHLQSHMRTHTGERPFKCPQCPYTATQNIHLRVHMRYIENSHIYVVYITVGNRAISNIIYDEKFISLVQTGFKNLLCKHALAM